MSRELHVDGTNPDDGLFGGADESSLPPFVVFDADAQENIAGPFNTAAEAEQHRLDILAGAKPSLDTARLRKWVDLIDGDGESVAEVAERMVR